MWTGCDRRSCRFGMLASGAAPHMNWGMLAIFTDREWLWGAAALYLAGFLLGTVSLLRGGRPSGIVMYSLIAVGFVLQNLGLAVRGHAVGARQSTVPFRCATGARMVHQNAPHEVGYDGDEVTTVLPVDFADLGDSQICFVHQRGRLK